jgi:hypothetical protein
MRTRVCVDDSGKRFTFPAVRLSDLVPNAANLF